MLDRITFLNKIFSKILPGTNATTERVFLVLIKDGQLKKKQWNIKTLKSIISLKYNLTKLCHREKKLYIFLNKNFEFVKIEMFKLLFITNICTNN